MINVMNTNKESMREVENCLDSQLWHACAGGMVQMPPVNSKVIYFPQGHIEHAQVNIDPKNFPKIPALIPSRISSIKYLADKESDEVYAKIRLVPLRTGNGLDFVGDDENEGGFDSNNKPASFAKTLTQSDANNGGGFSVPRYCAETIFPRLDYTVEPPVQTILAKDVHGVTWKFRHIYRGTPRRHLLTTGWSNFVNQKKLIAGDSIVFLRAENGDLCVGIRRAKRGGMGCGQDHIISEWNANCGGPYGGFPALLGDGDLHRMSVGSRNGKVRVESVVEAAVLAANGQPFEVVYYPRAGTPEFCVKESSVRAAMQIQWCAGMRFKMAFETEDSSRISWFMGTITSVQVADPVHWPNSPWRLLQVAWDEPDLLQNVKRVNPWLVELVSSMPTIHMSLFSPPRKKLRLPQPPDLPFADQFPVTPSFPNSALSPKTNPLFGIPDKITEGVQGARHSQFTQFLSDLHLNKLHSSHYPLDNTRFLPQKLASSGKDNLSCTLTMGCQGHNLKGTDDMNMNATPKFMLFGKPILTEQQISQNSSSSSKSTTGSSTSDVHVEKVGNSSDDSLNSSSDNAKTKLGLGIFMESEDIGCGLGLPTIGSYEELYKKIAQHVWRGKVRDSEKFAM